MENQACYGKPKEYKFYGVYLAYAKWDMMDKNDEDYENLPNYPKQFARFRVFDNKLSQLECYANTPCPASQTFEANSKEEVEQKIKEFKENFENENWLEENIYPYI